MTTGNLKIKTSSQVTETCHAILVVTVSGEGEHPNAFHCLLQGIAEGVTLKMAFLESACISVQVAII